MESFDNTKKYNPYEKDVPNQGERFEEDGKTVSWGLANEGDTIEQALEYKDGKGKTPLEAKEIDTPEGKQTIVKWEVEEEQKEQ